MTEAGDCRTAIVSLRQQVKALAAIAGVLLAALRRSGPIDADLEALLARGLVDAAAAQSENARHDWDAVVSATRRIVAASAKSTGTVE